MEEGDPSLASVDVTVFLTSPAAGEALRGVFVEVLTRAPLYATLAKTVAITARLAVQ